MTRPLALGALVALILPTAAASAAARPDFDVRDGLRAPVTAVRGALPGQATISPLTGTVRTLMRRGATLTGPSGAPAATIARDYLAAHARGIGLDAGDVAAFGRARVVRAPGGLRTVRFGGEIAGIPTFDSAVTVGLDRDGRIVTVTGEPAHDLSVTSTVPAVDARAALARFATATGTRAPERTSPARGPRRETRFAGGFARLVVFAMPTSVDRLAWHVYLGGYDGVVDAATGEVLRRHSTVKHAAPAAVFPNFPGASQGGAATTVDLEAPGWLPADANALSGPFVHAYTDTANDDTPDAADEVPRTTGGNFVYPFKRFSTKADDRCIGTALAPDPWCSWDSSDAATFHDNLKNTTVQTFYLDNTWYDHLLAPPIGFDKASGNFADEDPVHAQTDDSADTYFNVPLVGLVAASGAVNNANMATPPDGTAPVMQMYLGAYDDVTLAGLFRDYNNGDDAATVFHEYTHGLSNRLITKADGSGALDSAQAGAMGEDWGDWYAFDYLVRNDLSPDSSAPSEVDIGIYSDAERHATRTQGLDCPVGTPPDCPGAGDAGAGGYTYGDFGKIAGGAEVHADGEIWGETLWDLRSALVSREGGQAAGSDVAEALVTAGMRLSPPEPSFLNERDAIIQADVALYGGEHVGLLWAVFAARGMGVDASTSGGDDEAPKENFLVPPVVSLTGTLTATPATLDPGGTVNFDASSFGSSSTFAKGYRWDFDGDGTTDATTTAPTTSTVYTRAGRFQAKVTVTDEHGSMGEAVAPITVRGPAATGAVTIARRGTKGRVSVRANCVPSCALRITARLSKVTARRLGVKRTLKGTTGTATGKRTFRLRLSAKARRRARRRHLRTVKVAVRVQVTPDGGETRLVRRTVKVRV